MACYLGVAEIPTFSPSNGNEEKTLLMFLGEGKAVLGALPLLDTGESTQG